MKKFPVIAISFFLISILCNGQNVTCKELMDYVVKNGTLKGNVNYIQLMDSSWLKDVKAYTIENTIVVIAEIKVDEYGFNTKKYIFCGISRTNWDYFYNGFSDPGTTFGERFRKYIFDNKCNCS